MVPSKEVYQHNPLYELSVYDLRLQGSAERLRRERDAWGEYAETEGLGEDHVALIVRPGGARSLAA